MLIHYNPDLPLKLDCDTSGYGVGAVVSQFFPRVLRGQSRMPRKPSPRVKRVICNWKIKPSLWPLGSKCSYMAEGLLWSQTTSHWWWYLAQRHEQQLNSRGGLSRLPLISISIDKTTFQCRCILTIVQPHSDCIPASRHWQFEASHKLWPSTIKSLDVYTERLANQCWCGAETIRKLTSWTHLLRQDVCCGEWEW